MGESLFDFSYIIIRKFEEIVNSSYTKKVNKSYQTLTAKGIQRKTQKKLKKFCEFFTKIKILNPDENFVTRIKGLYFKNLIFFRKFAVDDFFRFATPRHGLKLRVEAVYFCVVTNYETTPNSIILYYSILFHIIPNYSSILPYYSHIFP